MKNHVEGPRILWPNHPVDDFTGAELTLAVTAAVKSHLSNGNYVQGGPIKRSAEANMRKRCAYLHTWKTANL